MALPGQLTKADYIPMDIFKGLLKNLEKDENWQWEFYLMFSMVTALRVVDVTSTAWRDIFEVTPEGLKVKRKFVKKEQKTGKTREISFSPSVADRIDFLYIKLGSPTLTELIFPSKKNPGKSVSKQYINAELKRIKAKYSLQINNFSTHSFRKTFARHYWEMNNKSSESLILLMDVLNHSSIAMTKKYLGITSEEIAGVYSSFEF